MKRRVLAAHEVVDRQNETGILQQAQSWESREHKVPT